MQEQKTPIQSLYVLKAICAYLVVCIHCMPVGIEKIGLVVNMAVPCFFLISGYMLYRGDENQEIVLAKKRCKKILLIAVLLHIVCLAWGVFVCHLSFPWWVYPLTFFSGFYLVGHQWYLFALWQIYFLFAFFRRFRKFLIMSIPVLIAIRGGLGGIPNILEYNTEYNVVWPRVFLIGVPFFATGYLMRRYEAKLCEQRWISYVSILSIGLCWWWGVSHDNVWNTYGLNILFLYAAACGSMLLCLLFKNASLPILNWIGRYHSANIYYVHAFMTPLATKVMWHLFRLREMDLLPLFVFAVSLFLSVLFTSSVWCIKKIRSRRPTPLPG